MPALLTELRPPFERHVNRHDAPRRRLQVDSRWHVLGPALDEYPRPAPCYIDLEFALGVEEGCAGADLEYRVSGMNERPRRVGHMHPRRHYVAGSPVEYLACKLGHGIAEAL